MQAGKASHLARASDLDASDSPFLRGFLRFHSLSAEERVFLQALESRSVMVPPRRALLSEGRPHEHVLIVRTGWLIEYKMLRDGRRQILNFRLPGEVAGLELLAYGRAVHSVRSLQAAEVARLPLDALAELQQRFPRLATVLFIQTLREEAILHEWQLNLGRRRAEEKVAHLLMELLHRMRVRGLSDGDAFPMPVTQQELADCVGLTAVHVNRVLGRMRAQGLFVRNGRMLQVTDPERLIQIGRFDPRYLDDVRD